MDGARRFLLEIGIAPIEMGEGDFPMIEVTRLNGNRMILNSDLIKTAEASPDTMLTLIHGEKLIVRESCEEILQKVLVYRATLLAAVAAQSESGGSLQRMVAISSLRPIAAGDSSASAGSEGYMAR
jgi:flagellar protein FlbD